MELAEAINLFKAGVPDLDDEDVDVDKDDDGDDVFALSESGVSDSRSISTVVPREKWRWMADLFGDIMGEAATPCPPRLPLACRMTCRGSALAPSPSPRGLPDARCSLLFSTTSLLQEGTRRR